MGSMKTKYHGNERVKRAQLQTFRRTFELLEMKNGESVSDYFTRVMMVANDMRNCGDDMQDVKIVEKILRTLTENFNYIVCSIEESKNIDTMSMDTLQSSLLVHEQKMRRPSNGAEEQLLKMSYEKRGGRGRGRGRGFGRGRGRGRFNRATVECFKCHKLGHFQYECQEGNKANYAEADEDEGDVLLMAFSPIKEEKEEAWYLDSGCSNHMCGDNGWFSMLDESFGCSVKLGNNCMLSVVRKGNVNMSVNGRSHIISDVYLVPELTSNLVSLGQLVQKGCEILFQNKTCKIYHSEFELIIQSQMTVNKLFKIMATRRSKDETEICLKTTSID